LKELQDADGAWSWYKGMILLQLAEESFFLTTLHTPTIEYSFNAWLAIGNVRSKGIGILLEESPWLLEATTEAEQQARIATLFDLNNLANKRGWLLAM